MATVPLNLCLDLSFYKSTFLLTVLSAFPESPHLTALRLKLPEFELNHPKITQWCNVLSIWQIDKVIILMCENVFFQAYRRERRKNARITFGESARWVLSVKKRSRNVLLMLYFIPNNLHLWCNCSKKEDAEWSGFVFK